MLDPWIIEEILKKEEELRREQERGHAQIPVPSILDTGETPSVTPPRDPLEQTERGVVIIDI